MTADVRHSGNDGRESDDWLGSGEVDWGEPPAGTRPARTSSRPGEPLWDVPAAGHPDSETIRRRRLVALVAGLGALAVVIIVAVVAFGGGDSTVPETPTTVAQETPITPTTPKTNTTPKTDTTPETPAVTITLAEGETLRVGATGQEVKDVQQALTTLGYTPGAADGDFGATTAAAVGEFQRDHNLADDGVVGPTTADAINEALASGSGSTSTGTGTGAAGTGTTGTTGTSGGTDTSGGTGTSGT